tara:strand:+ start:11263 stop:11484 length:222 start_codon:yes stop_codon:yes gene_type:complete
MILTIYIKEKDDRIKFAQEVRNLVDESTTYIPRENPVVKSDIGVKADVSQDQYEAIIALIERRGYTYNEYIRS